MVQKIKQYRSGLGHFISSEKGQRFFNFAYSIGAAIVIWGALFKILHLPGGNTLLSIGMGTEVLMFLLTAFDRPPREYKWEDVFPALRNEKDEEEAADEESVDMPQMHGASQPAGIVGGGVVYVGAPSAGGGVASSAAQVQDTSGVASGILGTTGVVAAPEANAQYVGATPELATEMSHLVETTRELNRVHDTLLESYRAITENANNISGNSNGYVEQMQALNHNIAALNTIYEIQLKSISGQLDSIDRVNRGISEIRDMFESSARQSARYCQEAEKMAHNMQQLNQVYERMITAMTINMYHPGMPMAAAAAAPAATADPAAPAQTGE